MSHVNNKAQRDAIRNTWLKRVPDFVDFQFYTGGVTDEEDVICLNCGDTYEDCAQKQYKIIQDCKSHDYLFQCDDDTFVVVERLLVSGYREFDYYGYYMKGDHGVFAHGGAGFFLSKHAMSFCKQPKEGDTYSDRYVGHAMRKAGIVLERNSFFNPGKYVGAEGEEEGFANLLPTIYNQYVTSHYMTPELMEEAYQHFYGDGRKIKNVYHMPVLEAVFFESRGKWRYGAVSPRAFKSADDAEAHCQRHMR